MHTVDRNTLKAIFKKVKKLHLPKDVELVEFDTLTYYSFPDESSQCLFVIADYNGVSTGLKLDFIKSGSGPLRLGFCEFCHKHRKSHDVLFVSTETKKRPKHVNYRSRGTWVCADYTVCNTNITDPTLVQQFFFRILEDV